jgi:hypothetical protein
MTTITREQFSAGVQAAACHIPVPVPGAVAREAFTAFITAAGIEVEKSAEERIAAFVAAVKAVVKAGHFMERGCPFCDVIREHFPEVRS